MAAFKLGILSIVNLGDMYVLCPKVHANIGARAQVPVQILESNDLICPLLKLKLAIHVYFNFSS